MNSWTYVEVFVDIIPIVFIYRLRKKKFCLKFLFHYFHYYIVAYTHLRTTTTKKNKTNFPRCCYLHLIIEQNRVVIGIDKKNEDDKKPLCQKNNTNFHRFNKKTKTLFIHRRTIYTRKLYCIQVDCFIIFSAVGLNEFFLMKILFSLKKI